MLTSLRNANMSNVIVPGLRYHSEDTGREGHSRAGRALREHCLTRPA
jgi:hypothetical protein